ncbi:MAG TPA: hypothetical protein VGR35_11120 [Tepidisphaeraceae bacterium]|nr:hypothetical protein [Tepidisphaeraceae bacterium]
MGYRSYTACLFLLALTGLARAQTTRPEGVVIEYSAPEVQTRTFDPKNLPPDMPPLRPGEAAVTESNFSCQTVIAATIIDQIPSAQGCTATMRIASVRTTIKLGITIWLPVKGTKKLTAHEQGHRIIDERFYENAEAIARKLSEEMVGQRRVGRGPNCDAAAQIAIKQAADQLCGDYMTAVQRPASRVQELYDEITDHGRHPINEAVAIKRAMEQQKKEAEQAAATQPTATP